MATCVFVGVQRLRNQAQQRIVEAIMDVLLTSDCWPVVIGHDPHAATRDPLPKIREAIAGCDGAIVVAFERLRLPLAIEFPDTEHAQVVVERRVSAVWDHIEAAMAYQAGLPVLILQERGLYQYGMINTRRSTIDFHLFSTHDAEDSVESVRQQVRTWCEQLAAQPGACLRQPDDPPAE